MKLIIKNTIILTLITLVSGLALGLSYEVTKEPIAKANEDIQKAAYAAVMPEADTFEDAAGFDAARAEEVLVQGNFGNNVINGAVSAIKGGTEIGYVITVTNGNGYGGNITSSVGILSDGTITGIRFISISETAGLGMNATKPDFYTQFEGRQTERFAVTKTGATAPEEIDALSGATVTSTAVVDSVNAALFYFQELNGGGGANE